MNLDWQSSIDNWRRIADEATDALALTFALERIALLTAWQAEDAQ